MNTTSGTRLPYDLRAGTGRRAPPARGAPRSRRHDPRRQPEHLLLLEGRLCRTRVRDGRHRAGRRVPGDRAHARLVLVRSGAPSPGPPPTRRREARRRAPSLSNLGLDRQDLADAIAGHYQSARERGVAPIEGAIETVRWLRANGCRLALLTNGDGRAQRSKIDRFGLAPMFDHILIEGDVGYGKPDPRVYELALARLEVHARDAWMAGDNLEWDVVAPQRRACSGSGSTHRAEAFRASVLCRPAGSSACSRT